MRNQFLLVGGILVLGTWGLFYLKWLEWWLPVLLLGIYLLGIYNAIQTKHAILRNYPILGYFRYAFEGIAPEIQQYFIERDTDGKPFPRSIRSSIYRRAKNLGDTVAFGTQLDVNTPGYRGIKHSIYAKKAKEELPRVLIGNHQCSQPYSASLFNISAMSFGSLSDRAQISLNNGARKGKFYHNTGEGGISPYHLQGGDLCWQIGTGYFGARDKEGNFSPDLFQKNSMRPEVKLIELKISQGAKPGHGGVLPAKKNSPEIANIRNVEPHTDVLSPPGHSAFNDAEGLVKFIQNLRDLSGGKPVGFKLCIGDTTEFDEICRKMTELNIYPDFITVDGSEGGTGAAPLEFSDGVGMPLEPALIYVHKTLEKYKIRPYIKLIASGKLVTSLHILRALAMGADLCNSARGFMFALGCIQALRCHNNTCPTGVATQDAMLKKGLNVVDKSERVYQFHKNTLHSCNELLGAAGLDEYSEISADIFMKGEEFYDLHNQSIPNNLN